MNDPTADPPFPDACCTGGAFITPCCTAGTVVDADATERGVFWTPRRDGA